MPEYALALPSNFTRWCC